MSKFAPGKIPSRKKIDKQLAENKDALFTKTNEMRDLNDQVDERDLNTGLINQDFSDLQDPSELKEGISSERAELTKEEMAEYVKRLREREEEQDLYNEDDDSYFEGRDSRSSEKQTG